MRVSDAPRVTLYMQVKHARRAVEALLDSSGDREARLKTHIRARAWRTGTKGQGHHALRARAHRSKPSAPRFSLA